MKCKSPVANSNGCMEGVEMLVESFLPTTQATVAFCMISLQMLVDPFTADMWPQDAEAGGLRTFANVICSRLGVPDK
jgi:hypothetical protein